MNKQVTIRPQDIVVLLKIVVLAQTGNDWLKKDLADSLNLANSEITKVFERLRFTGLIVGTRVQSLTFYEYLIYGLKATFPPSLGPEVRGLLTGSGALPEGNITGSDYVWAHAEGKTKGTSITPLYSEVVFASEKDHNLYLALSACEMLRVGRVTEINFARQWLKVFITGKD
ncbi:MAG: hypothetical protein ACOYXT_15605 [Bacteroidota bacterium]